jgi:fido (protein-threonine AMPylation protein)
MPLTPGYGETPLPHDELTALLPHVVEVLETPVSRAAVYDLEQAVQEQVSEELLTAAFNGSLSLDELLTDYFVRDLHERLYGDIWSWAGRWRQRDVNIGVDPRQIAVELRSALDNIRYRWEHGRLDSPRAWPHNARRDCAGTPVHRRKWPHHKASCRSRVHHRPGSC